MVENEKDKIILDLQEEVATLKSIIYKLPGNVYWKNIKGSCLGSNKNMAKLLKLASPELLIGKPITEIMPLELVERTRKVDLKVLDLQKEKTFEEKGINHRGKPAVYLSRKSPFYDNKGNLIGTVGVSLDITKQKRLEEKLRLARQKAEAANYAKSLLLAMVSHELRNPLTSIVGFATFMLKEKLVLEEKQTYIKHVIHSSNYLLQLVNKLLEFTKLGEDKTGQMIALAPLDLKMLVEDVHAMLVDRAKQKKLAIYIEYDATLPTYIISDGRILKQILINLVENAIKFTKVGSITIKVTCIKKNEKFAKLDIAVQDTGIGIPADKLKSVFKEFYQINDVYQSSIITMGNGLGLAIVKKLIKMINGRIQVKSEINRGSVFSFASTFSLPQMTDKSPSVPQTTQITPLTEKRQVLLVDDDALVQIVHHKMLSHLGCQVDIAENGKKALHKLKNNYNMIFIDIGLPDLNGFELIKKIRKKTAHLSHIPIVALTGFFTEEEKKRCMKAGADQVLIKPVSQEILKEVLNRYMQAYNLVEAC